MTQAVPHTCGMPLSSTRPLFSPPVRRPSALVGVPAGLLAGIAYLLAQALYEVVLLGGLGSEPFQRIAAMLLGPDAAPPPAEWTSRAVGIALIIHLPLSAIYGRLVDALVMYFDNLGAAGLIGGVTGAVLYLVNRCVIAPFVFPWFDASRSLVTATDHVLFGVIAGLACVTLRRALVARRLL